LSPCNVVVIVIEFVTVQQSQHHGIDCCDGKMFDLVGRHTSKQQALHGLTFLIR
jgi:hypothetical protein